MMMHVTTVRDQMATQTDEQADNLADEQLAARYGKHVRTVMRWRRLRAGPPRFRDPGGTVWYRLEAVRGWEAEQEAASRPLSPEDRATA
jgi:hypothetical protein